MHLIFSSQFFIIVNVCPSVLDVQMGVLGFYAYLCIVQTCLIVMDCETSLVHQIIFTLLFGHDNKIAGSHNLVVHYIVSRVPVLANTTTSVLDTFFKLVLLFVFVYCIFCIPKCMCLLACHCSPRNSNNCKGILNVTYSLALHLTLCLLFTRVQTCPHTQPHSPERKYSIFPKAHPGKKKSQI